MVAIYERELRAVLSGSPAGVRAVTRSCDDVARARAMQVIERPFLVVRVAGSGMEGSGDLLALRGDICFPIEVKTSKERKLYLSARTWDQYEEMREIGERCGLMPLYAYRLKGVRGDSWRIFRIETESLTGRLGVLSRRIPPLPLTRNGKPHLDWEQGLPLHQFLGVVCRNEEPSGGLSHLVKQALEVDLEPEQVSGETEEIPVRESMPTWMERFRL
jgi:Holliday junction resolvase